MFYNTIIKLKKTQRVIKKKKDSTQNIKKKAPHYNFLYFSYWYFHIFKQNLILHK